MDTLKNLMKVSIEEEEKYMKIKFNSDGELPLSKTTESFSMIIVVTAFFYENKYYPQVLLDECLYQL